MSGFDIFAIILVLLVIPLYELWIRRRPFMAPGRPSQEASASPLLPGQGTQPAR